VAVVTLGLLHISSHQTVWFNNFHQLLFM